MKQYIDKGMVKAEIERRKNQFISQAESFHKIGMEDKEGYFAALASNMNSLSCFIDSLDDKCDGCNNVKGCVTCKDGSEWAHYEEPVSNEMTKEEAIKYLQQLYPNGGHCWLDEQRIEAIGMAIKVLQEESVSSDLEEAAKKVGQKYFPNEYNIWARPNYEAVKVECAFKEGAPWQKEHMIEKAWDWIEDNILSSNQQDKSRLYFEQFKDYMKRE